MNRYNIFNQIHKGLRALLYETSLQLQQTDFSDDGQTGAVTAKVQLALELFEGHAHTEDHFILPKIETYEPSVSDAFEQEHVEDMELGQRVAGLLEILNGTATVESKKETGRQLVIAFVDFMVFNLEHMKKEEDILNKLLWRYYSDEELAGITQTIVASIPPDKMAVISKWMMRGLAEDEIIGWLKEVKLHAPAFIYQPLYAMAAAELPESRWMRVKEAMGEEMMVA